MATRVFDETDPVIKGDIMALIHQYLLEQSLLTTATAIQEELAMKSSELVAKRCAKYDIV
jgi:hypothetical protein